MRLSFTLLGVAILFGVVLFIFQPKNVEGPRVKPVRITEGGFPYGGSTQRSRSLSQRAKRAALATTCSARTLRRSTAI